ncbi:MAG: NAD-binding protein [Planctomycetota bacterium]
MGAGRWQRSLAELLKKHGFRSLLVDTNRRNTQAARMAGLDCMNGSVLNEHFVDRMELGGIGRVFAATPNDLVNVLAVKKLTRIFGRANAYQVAPINPGEDKKTQKKAEGRTEARILFDEKASWQDLDRRIATKSVFKATPLSDEFTLDHFKERYGEKALPLFVLTEKKNLQVFEADEELTAEAGDTLISLVEEPPPEEEGDDSETQTNAAAAS